MTRTLAIAICLMSWLVSVVGAQSDANSGPTKITFRSGNQIEANIVTQTADENREFVVFGTPSGSLLKLDRGKWISRLVPRGPDHVEYDRLIATMPESPESHWEMYEWCKADGRRSQFKQEIEYHLKQIVKLDASDSKAWQLLGYIEVAGRWLPEEQHYLSRGYVKAGGRWIPGVQVEIDRQQDAQQQLLNDRKIALNKWKKHIWPNSSVDVIRSELFKIVDPVAIAFLEDNYLRNEKNPQTRSLYLEAIGQVASPQAQRILVDYAMKDDDQNVREAALSQLEQPHFDQDGTSQLFARYLTNSNNAMINRAARIIGRLNRNSAIIPLINSLVTEHKVTPGGDPGRLNIGFGSGGTGLSTGGEKPVIRMFKNEDVLLSLERISGQRRLGYDEQSWKQWYVSQHTITDYDFRRDND